MTTSNKSVNAWILLDEDNPAGTSYKSPTSCYQTLIDYGVYKSTDMVNICFFITLPTSSSTVPVGDGSFYTIQIGNATSTHPDGSTTEEYLKWLIADARKTNPNIKLMATLGYGQDYFSNIFESSLKAPEQLAAEFANNLLAYLQQYNLDGFDVDWEGNFSSSITVEQFKILFTAIRTSFNLQSKKYYYLTLSPASVGNLDPTTVNDVFDFVNIQLYSGFSPESEFINAGIQKELLAYGAKFESRGNDVVAPYQDAQNAYQGYSSRGYHKLTQWRLNSGNYQFEQAQQMILYDLINGIQGTLFNDSSIVGAAGNPPITQFNIRAGDVLNAIQATNTGTFSGVPLKYLLLQHGGDSGNLNTVTVPSGDVITEITGYRGIWFGWDCVLQLTIKTKNGSVFGPYGSMNNTTSHERFVITAPDGQSIVAFSGSIVNVPLQTGARTNIIASLDASFTSIQSVDDKTIKAKTYN